MPTRRSLWGGWERSVWRRAGARREAGGRHCEGWCWVFEVVVVSHGGGSGRSVLLEVVVVVSFDRSNVRERGWQRRVTDAIVMLSTDWTDGSRSRGAAWAGADSTIIRLAGSTTAHVDDAISMMQRAGKAPFQHPGRSGESCGSAQEAESCAQAEG